MARPKKRVRKVAAVVWLDATFQDHHEDRLTPEWVITYGEIVDVTKEYITLVGEVHADKDARAKTSIPMGMVKKIIRGTIPDPFPKKDVE